MEPILVVLVIAALLVVSLWAAIRSERPVRDDEPTLDVQNHVGDSRPVR